MWADVYCEVVEWIPSFLIIQNDKKQARDCFLFAYLLQLFAYFYENFCVEKKISDMVKTLQWDQTKKM